MESLLFTARRTRACSRVSANRRNLKFHTREGDEEEDGGRERGGEGQEEGRKRRKVV